MNILKAVNLRKIYGQGETEVRALDGINLEVEKGEFVLYFFESVLVRSMIVQQGFFRLF